MFSVFLFFFYLYVYDILAKCVWDLLWALTSLEKKEKQMRNGEFKSDLLTENFFFFFFFYQNWEICLQIFLLI